LVQKLFFAGFFAIGKRDRPEKGKETEKKRNQDCQGIEKEGTKRRQ